MALTWVRWHFMTNTNGIVNLKVREYALMSVIKIVYLVPEGMFPEVNDNYWDIYGSTEDIHYEIISWHQLFRFSLHDGYAQNKY